MNIDLDEFERLTQALYTLPSGEERDEIERHAELLRQRIWDTVRRDQKVICDIEDVAMCCAETRFRANTPGEMSLGVMDFFDQETTRNPYWVELTSRVARYRTYLTRHQTVQINLVGRKHAKES